MKTYSFNVTIDIKDANYKVISTQTKVFKSKNYFTARLKAIKFCNSEYEKIYKSRRTIDKNSNGMYYDESVSLDSYVDFSVKLNGVPYVVIYSDDIDKQMVGLSKELKFLEDQKLLGSLKIKVAHLNETLEFCDPMFLLGWEEDPEEYDDEYSSRFILDKDLDLLFAIHED